MKTPKFATHWENRPTHKVENKEPSMTQQQFAAECDINNILKKYEKTGLLPDMIKTDPQYGDFSDVPSYQEALTLIQKAELQFSNLDAHIRRKFDNDPSNFLDFATNPDNLKEMVKLGLATEIKPMPDPVVIPPATEVKK